MFIGTAGWTLPKQYAPEFPGEGPHLQRYAARFTGVEINSSFHRPHRKVSYERWAASVPDHFRFAVKIPKVITHTRRLVDTVEPLETFLDQVSGLGPKLGPLLVQLPPSLALDYSIARAFLDTLRERFEGGIVMEPRHASWFGPEGQRLLVSHQVARVAADPAPVPAAAEPGGWTGLVYYRLHGSPRMYYSPYSDESIMAMATKLVTAEAEAWCMFDNTTWGHATGDALQLLRDVGAPALHAGEGRSIVRE